MDLQSASTPAPAAKPEGATIAELLGKHHRQLDALFVESRALAGDLRAAADVFARFDRGLRRHIHVEEEMLFPVFEKVTGMHTGPTTVMRMEHARIKELLEEIAQGLACADAIDHAAGELGEVLGAHNAKEEVILYPLSDERVGARERTGLVEQMRRFLAE